MRYHKKTAQLGGLLLPGLLLASCAEPAKTTERPPSRQAPAGAAAASQAQLSAAPLQRPGEVVSGTVAPYVAGDSLGG